MSITMFVFTSPVPVPTFKQMLLCFSSIIFTQYFLLECLKLNNELMKLMYCSYKAIIFFCFLAFSHDFIGEFTTSYRELSRGQSQFNVYEVSRITNYSLFNGKSNATQQLPWIPLMCPAVLHSL